MKLFARLVSYLFHPVLFFLTMPFFIVYRHTESEMYALKWMIFSSVFIFIGVMLIIFETIKGDFSDFDVSKKEQRRKFFLTLLVLGVLYLITAVVLKGIFFPLSFITLGLSIGIIIFAFISKYIKASIHAAASCSFVLTLYILFGIQAFYACVWFIPLVAWARLYLKRHTIFEVISGGLLGFLITVITYIMGKYILYHKWVW